MNLEERVITVIKENSEDVEVISIESNLRTDLGIDSFGTLMIINGIEDEFGISIDEDHFDEIKTVQNIVTILQSKYSVKG